MFIMKDVLPVRIFHSTGCITDFHCSTCSSLSPVLTLRFAISLKKSADPEGGEKWELKHFSRVDFARGSPPDTQYSAAYDTIEMDFVGDPHGRMRMCESPDSIGEIGLQRGV